MKKTIMIALCALTFIAAACSKDNEGKKDKTPKVAKLEVCLDVETISQDILDYFTITYNYTDFKGNTVSKAIDAPTEISFSIDNPNLGEVESCPFTVELTFQEKGTPAKAEGQYMDGLVCNLNVNGYYSDGKLITDSGSIISLKDNMPYTTLDAFKKAIGKSSIKQITLKTFFCKTISGEWHIGTVRSDN